MRFLIISEKAKEFYCDILKLNESNQTVDGNNTSAVYNEDINF